MGNNFGERKGLCPRDLELIRERTDLIHRPKRRLPRRIHDLEKLEEDLSWSTGTITQLLNEVNRLLSLMDIMGIEVDRLKDLAGIKIQRDS